MAGISFGGLASGLDTDTIIQQLMAVESQPRTRLVYNQTAAQTRQQALQDVRSRLTTLRFATDDLASGATWSPTQSVSTSDATKLSAVLNGGAAPGGYNIEVTQLATAAQSTFTFAQQSSASTIDVNGKTVNLDANATLDSVVATINGNTDLGVFAVNVDGSKLVLTSRTTGSATSITASGTSLTAVSSTAGQDALVKVNGGAATAYGSNVVKNLIPGVDVTIKSLTSGTTIAVGTPEVDRSAVKDKVKSFISAYNDLLSFVNGKLSEKSVSSPQNASDAAKGALYGDLGLEGMVSQLRIASSSPIAGLASGFSSLADIGVSTGAPTGSNASSADSLAGKLVLDEDKLDAALDADPLAVQKLLGGVTGTDGFSQALNGVVVPLVTAGGTMDQRIDSAGDELKSVNDSITRMDDRLATKEQQLRAQFTAMELALQRSQSQASDLFARLGQSSS